MQKEAYRAWFAGIACSVASGLYTLYQLRAQGVRAKEVQGTDAEKAVEGKRMLRDRKQAQTQLLSDVCDLTVPGAALGYFDLDDGVVGLAGTFSSLLGVQNAWAKTA